MRVGGSFVRQVVLRIGVGTQNGIEVGHRGGQRILRIENQQLGLRYLDVRQAEVERGSQLGIGKRANLLVGGLARVHGLLRNLEHGLRGERLVERLVDGQRDVFYCRSLAFQLRPGVRLCALDEIMGAAEIGDELVHRQAPGGAVENGWGCSARPR